MPTRHVSDQPIEIMVAPDAVVVIPPATGLALTPEAAVETARRMVEAACHLMSGGVEGSAALFIQ